ncbi:MAG: chaperone protein HscA [Pseudomonadota bacterium]|jgi:molecular chaperone HscA
MAANIGIDLGTTHSLVAVVLGGKARCLLDETGDALLPSAVRVEDDGTLVVGRAARDEAAAHPGRTFTSTKRFMGRAPADCREDAARLRATLDEAEGRFVRFRAGSRTITPVEVAAAVLKTLRARAVECLFGEPGGAVITVPAYFDDAQRQATKDAARLAGLEVLRLLNEPTAAAVAYGLDARASGRFAVYDLGGGTFDVSILELDDGIFQVLATAGDTHLGGDDFDRLVAEHLRSALGLGDLDDSAHRALLQAAEAAKRRLGEADATEVAFAGRSCTLTRETFDALVAPVLARTGDAARQALGDAGLTADQLDAVVLVGGSTRAPVVRRYVEGLFGRAPRCDLDPDQVVALGAAMQADMLSGAASMADDMLLLDVIPLSLGLELMGGVVEKFIPRCSTIPVSAHHTFTTHVDDQTSIDLHVVQGDRELARDNRSLARFRLAGLPPLPAGVPRVRVEFTVDADGLLTVSAREEYTGLETRVDVRPSYGLSEEEIERMLEDSIDHAEDDVEARMAIEARVEAEGILAALDKALATDRALLEPGEEERVVQVAEALRAALPGSDRARVRELSQELDAVTAPFAQRRIERDLTRALSGRDALAVDAELASRAASAGGVAGGGQPPAPGAGA